MSDNDKIVSFLRTTGPVLPTQVAKHLNSNILLASAQLSEISSQGKIKISKLKVGGSPLYYVPEHREKLQNFTHVFNPKDQDILKLIKERKILREKSLDLLARVSLRSLKDFAIPLNVSLNEEKELFWKWYLLDDQQAADIIKDQWSHLAKEKENSAEKEIKQEPVEEIQSQQEGERKREKEIEQQITETQSELQQPSKQSEPQQELFESKQPHLQQPEIPTQEPQQFELSQESVVSQKIQEPELKEQTILEEVNKGKEEEKEENNSQDIIKGNAKQLIDKEAIEQKLKNKEDRNIFAKIKEKFKPAKRKEIIDEFTPKLDSFFNDKNIIIDTKDTIRKNSEIDFILKVPSVVGPITYFCKAKSKKKCNEKDLSAAYMMAQNKKLPLLFLYTEEISKKAREMIDSGTFENMIIKKIE